MKVKTKTKEDCPLCQFAEICPIPNDDKCPVPDEIMMRACCPMNEDARSIHCVSCFFCKFVFNERGLNFFVCKVNGKRLDDKNVSCIGRPPKWCPILEAKRKGL